MKLNFKNRLPACQLAGLMALLLFTASLAYAGALFVPSTTNDLPDTANKRYVTDAEKDTLSSLPSITAAVESTVTDTLIKTKLGAATDNADGYMTQADHALMGVGLLHYWATLGGALPLTNCPPTTEILNAAAALGFDQNHIFCVVFPVGGQLSGLAQYIGAGSLAASGAGNAALTGSALQYALGSLTGAADSYWYGEPSGIAQQYALGGLSGAGGGTATLIGFANIATLGTVIGAVDTQYAAVVGVEQGVALGSLAGHGDGNITLTGLAQSEVMGSVTGTVTGGGPTAVSDNFNRANGSLGANWTAITSMSGHSIAGTSYVYGTSSNGSYWSANAFANNQYSEATYATGDDITVAVRASPSAQTYYYATAYNFFDDVDDWTYFEIYKVVGGSSTLLASSYIAGSRVSNNIYTVRLTASGTTLTMYTGDATNDIRETSWTQRHQITDSSIASGSAGFIASANAWWGGDL